MVAVQATLPWLVKYSLGKIFRVFVQRVFEIDFQLPDEIGIVPELHCLFIWDS